MFRIDRATGDVHFGPAVREPDGSLRGYGAVPPKGAPLRVPAYRVGGGPTGNVSAGTVRVLRSTVPGVDRVENRRAAIGGVAPETVAEAKLRGPLALRTRDRAVTAEDYDQLARAAAPQVARVRTVPADSADEAGGVRVLVVPAAPTDVEGQLRFEDLVPTEETLQAVDRLHRRAAHRRRPGGRRAAVLPGRHGGRHAGRAAPDCARGAGAGRRCSRSTATTARSRADRTAPGGRSAGRSRQARCTPCSSGCRAPS